jgi:hypothetical protein
MVDAHPAIAIPPESNFVTDLLRDRERYEVENGFATDAFLADLVRHERFRRWRVPEADVRGALAGTIADGYADAVRAVFAVWARREAKPRSGDKTPRHVLHLATLGELFPEARFVHLIRDGRDVALSWAEQFSVPVVFAIRRWARRVSRGRSAGRVLGPGCYREIRYEDLVADPERELRRLCGFVGLDFDPAMLRYHERAERLLASMPDRHRHERIALPLAPVRDWRSQMVREDVALCDLLAGDVLADGGYEPAGAPLSLRARARLARFDVADWPRRARREVRRLTRR